MVVVNFNMMLSTPHLRPRQPFAPLRAVHPVVVHVVVVVDHAVVNVVVVDRLGDGEHVERVLLVDRPGQRRLFSIFFT